MLQPEYFFYTGAFSTVRLAWRKTPEGADKPPLKKPVRSSYNNNLNTNHDLKKVAQSANVNFDVNDKPKGELVAVKIIQKSILKQMKSIEKGPNNRLTVRTAYDNIEREIATMKRLKHPNLIRLFEVIDSVESDRLHMVLEYVSLGEISSGSHIHYSRFIVSPHLLQLCILITTVM